MDNAIKLMLLFILAFSNQMKAQNLVKSPKPIVVKCVVSSHFDYDKKFEWKEVDCSSISEKKKENTKQQFIKDEKKRLKMLAYQEKLKNLGYDVDITGSLNEKIITAHNKYLKKRKKEEKRKLKKEKRKAKAD